MDDLKQKAEEVITQARSVFGKPKQEEEKKDFKKKYDDDDDDEKSRFNFKVID